MMRLAIVATALTGLVLGNTCRAQDRVFPGKTWERATPTEVGLVEKVLDAAKAYAETGQGSGLITRHGKVVMTWGDTKQLYDLKSTTKSIGVTALGLAIADGKVSLNDKAATLHPSFGTPPDSNAQTGWLDDITLKHLATQTAGFEKPGGYGKLLFEPGTQWHYSDAGPNWLAECLTLAYRQDMDELLFERVFTPIGITRDDLRWRKNQYRDQQIDGIERREFGSGIHANVDALARIGQLYLNKGRWGGKQLLSAEFVRAASRPINEVVGLPEHDGDTHGNATDHYGLLWWNNADGEIYDVPQDAYWSWGLHDSLIVVIPSLDIVAVRAGRGWKRQDWRAHYDVLDSFLQPLARAAKYWRPRITGIEWAPPETIVRQAKGSDNWPLTWADDDAMYTAYGDGWGFEPRVPEKLSLGIAAVTGGPDEFVGRNIRSDSAEATGNNVRGRKASGMLMVDGVLYMLARNVANSQLAWSTDHGVTWTWADWKFETSFGCPSFVNYGRNYTGAVDEFVYVVSFDSDSAYEPAQQLVLARVPKDQIRNRAAYTFAGQGTTGTPHWSPDVQQRVAILQRLECYRCNISFNAPLKTYLLAMTDKGDPQQPGGLAVFMASKPWGPWRPLSQTAKWDVAQGESASFPTKWMSADGRTVHLVFSGNDSFAVRRGELVLDEQ